MESLVLVSGVVGVIVIIAAALYTAARTQGLGNSFDMLTKANEGLRDTNTDLYAKLASQKKDAEDQKLEFQRQLDAQDAACQIQLAKLQAQLDTFTDGFVDRLIHAVAEGVKKGQESST